MDKTLSGIPEGIPAAFPIKPKITAAKEWPLFGFSLLTSIACALYFSKGSLGNSDWFRWLIPILGILAAILSLLHLGKKWRAWRAVLNVERSWLSREILFFIFFLAAVIIDYFFHDLPDAVGIANGILLLISIDMLYQPATWQWQLRLHSAQAVFIALSLCLLLSGFDILFILFTTFRSGLYTLRRSQTGHAQRKHVLVSLARIWLPLLAIIVLLSTEALLPVVILTLVTDGIDRWMFYGDLRVAGEGSGFTIREEFAQRSQGRKGFFRCA
jgi:DMSO reductase anchor subunit